MKVFYIGSGYDGCYYVRCMLPLQANGWHGEWEDLNLPKKSKQQQFNEAMSSDIIVFQRPLTKDKYEAARLLKLKGKKIVMDNDDTYKPNSGIPKIMGKVKKAVQNAEKNLKEFAELSDLVTLSTDFLSKEYEGFDRIEVLPNYVDPLDWDEPLRNETDKVRIGITGSIAYTRDYEIISSLLTELSKRNDVQLVLMGIPKEGKSTEWQRKIYKKEVKFWKSLDIEWHSTVKTQDYPSKLNELKLDIQLIPRKDNYFNKCKSNIKYLESSMLEIPVVAQSFKDSPYEKDIDGENGRLAKTTDDWYRETEFLIKNKDIRRQIGRNAREYVVENYNINKHAHEWKEAYSKIL